MKKLLITVTAAITLGAFVISPFVCGAVASNFESEYDKWKGKIVSEFYIPKDVIDNNIDYFICYNKINGSSYNAQTFRVSNVQSTSTVTLYYNETHSPYQLKTTQFNKNKVYYIYDLGPLYQKNFDTSAVYENWRMGGSLYDFVKLNNNDG